MNNLLKESPVAVLLDRQYNNPTYFPEGTPPPKSKLQVLLDKPLSKGYIIVKNPNDTTHLAHEIGHAKDTTFLSGLRSGADNLTRSWMFPVLSTAVAFGLAKTFPKYKKSIALSNIGLNAALTVPMLWSEARASLDAVGKPGVNKHELWNMYKTYLEGAAAQVGAPFIGHALMGDLS